MPSAGARTCARNRLVAQRNASSNPNNGSLFLLSKRYHAAKIFIIVLGGSTHPFLMPPRIDALWMNQTTPSRRPTGIDAKNDSIGACANQTRVRCSDKGFLSMSIVSYLELLDASAKMVRPDKTGYTPGDIAPIATEFPWLCGVATFVAACY